MARRMTLFIFCGVVNVHMRIRLWEQLFMKVCVQVWRLPEGVTLSYFSTLGFWNSLTLNFTD